jgi:NAD+ diphosphatase
MRFIPHSRPPAGEERSGLFFIFANGRLMVAMQGGRARIPEPGDLAQCGFTLLRQQYIGSLDQRPCYAAEVAPGVKPADGFEFKELRSLFASLEEELLWVAGRANHLVYWQQTHLFCGACGHPTEDKANERAKFCPQCGLINYPRLSPAVIVAVLDGNRILLARNKRARIPFYSVLAGFVEPSETLEQCVAREVKEEVGITVTNIRYFGSQPWPFPNSLMIGFTADYVGGEISIDPAEITDAGWYSKDNLPPVPPKLSIAGRLIDWFCTK